MKKETILLTPNESQHVLYLLTRNREDGIYSGNCSQYWERARRIESAILAEKVKAIKSKSVAAMPNVES
jgi:hypothetical protein